MVSRRSMLGLLGVAVPTAAYARPSIPPHRLDEFDRFVAQRAEADLFSGTVLVARRGHPVLTRSYGMADKARSIPNGRDTLFNLASISKCFTAIAIGQLVQQERVRLYEPLGTYLDGFSEATRQVTVHQLLTHTAGMGNYYEAPEFVDGLKRWASAAEVMDGLMAIIRRMEVQPQFTAGTKHVYSDSGYVVLGAIVARVSGGSYYDYIRRHVLVPAGMRRSDLYTRPQLLERRDIAHPYWTPPTGGERADFTTSGYFQFVGGPDMGVYSTAPELLEFVDALSSGRLLDPAYTALFTGGKVPLSPTDPPLMPAQSRHYGYGFRDVITGGQRVFGHSGFGPGRATNLDVFPDLGWVVVVLCNYDTTVEPIVQKGREIITSLSGRR